MRELKTILKFFDHHIIDYLHDDGILTNNEFITLSENLEKVADYWLDNSDQRFFQVLINLNLIEDNIRWSIEDMDILMKYNIYLGDVLKWTSNYDKDMNLLEESITRYIKDLDTDHIEDIFKYMTKQDRILPDEYKYAFNQELERREDG